MQRLLLDLIKDLLFETLKIILSTCNIYVLFIFFKTNTKIIFKVLTKMNPYIFTRVEYIYRTVK